MSAQANILLHVAGSMASGTSLFLDEPATKSRQIFTSKAAYTQHAEAQVPSFGSFGTPEGGSLGHSYQAEDRPLAYKCGHSGVGGSDVERENAVTRIATARCAFHLAMQSLSNPNLHWVTHSCLVLGLTKTAVMVRKK